MWKVDDEEEDNVGQLHQAVEVQRQTSNAGFVTETAEESGGQGTQLVVGGRVSETGVSKKKSDVGRLLLRKPGVIRKTQAKKREGKELFWCVEDCRKLGQDTGCGGGRKKLETGKLGVKTG